MTGRLRLSLLADGKNARNAKTMARIAELTNCRTGRPAGDRVFRALPEAVAAERDRPVEILPRLS